MVLLDREMKKLDELLFDHAIIYMLGKIDLPEFREQIKYWVDMEFSDRFDEQGRALVVETMINRWWY